MKVNDNSEATMKWNFKDVIDNAIYDFEDAVKEEGVQENMDLVDLVHEIADANTPIMTCDILQYACHNMTLATEEPEICAFNGDKTGVNCIAGRMYEILCEKLTETLDKMEDNKCG